jgi:VWFA-related protein
MRPFTLVVCLLVTCVAQAGAQIISGSGRNPSPRGVPTIQLDTDLGPNRQPSFRAAVTRVQVSVRVLDADGQPVRGLTADDFTISEEGAPQRISSFQSYRFSPAAMQLHDVPPTGPLSATTSPVTNAYTSEARVFALVIDDLHIHPRRTERARAIGRDLVARLHPSDLLLVATTSGRHATLVFSRDRTAALRTIDAAFGQRLVDPTSEMLQHPGRHEKGGGGYASQGLAGSQQQRVMQLEMAYETITRVAAHAIDIPGRRKTLLYVSEGSPIGSTVNASGQVAGSGSANVALQNAMAAATVADMAIYTVTPTGLDVPGEFLIESNGRAVDGFGRDITHEQVASVVAEFLQTKWQLRDMASLTGGLALIDTNDASGALTRVMDDASEYYVLSYEPDKPAKNDKFRKIDVKVNRPNVRLVVRRGYAAPQGVAGASDAPVAGGLPPPLRALLGGTLPGDGLPLRAQAIPIGQGEASGTTRFALVVEADGAALARLAASGRMSLAVAQLALDQDGTAGSATRRTMAVTLSPEQLTLLGASALRMVSTLDLPAGAHQVRLAVLEEPSGVGGAVHLDVAVPDRGLPPGIGVGSRAWARVPTAFVDPPAAAALPIPPTAMRVFPGTDVLQVTVTGMPEAVAIRARDTRGAVVWEQPLNTGPEVRQLDLPLSALRPGQHRLTVGDGPDAPGIDFVVLGSGL